jgi:hypothetical protein
MAPLQASTMRSMNQWVARIIPMLLFGAIGYSSYVVIKRICCKYFDCRVSPCERTRLMAGICGSGLLLVPDIARRPTQCRHRLPCSILHHVVPDVDHISSSHPRHLLQSRPSPAWSTRGGGAVTRASKASITKRRTRSRRPALRLRPRQQPR